MPYLCAFILLYILCTTCFTLVKRSFDIVILLFVLPFVNATVPLDDGAHMKLWRETMISKILLAFGAVFSMAVFNIFAPLTMKIYIANNAVLTGVLRLLLIVGGGLSISGGMALISRLVGTGIAEGNEMASSARTLLAGGAGAIFTASRAIRGGKRLLLGSRGVDGKSHGGLVRLGGTALDMGGKLLGGNAYTGAKQKVGAGLSNALSKTKGAIMGNNGLIGALTPQKQSGLGAEIQRYSGRKL